MSRLYPASGFGAIIKSVEKLQHRIHHYMAGKFIERLGRTVVNSARQHAPLRKRAHEGSGGLRNSLRMQRSVRAVNGTLHTFAVTISYGEGLNPNYAPIVEHGTGKKFYTIVPRNKQMLHWKPIQGNLSYAWRDKKGWVHAKRVAHPGQQAQPFLAPALARAEAEIKPVLSRLIDREIYNFVKKGITRVVVK